jgi:hypothetical protein
MFAARPDRGNWRATFGMEESEIRDLGVLNGSQRKPSEGFMVGKIHHRRLAVTNTLLPSALSCICCWQCLVVCCRYMYLILVTTSHIPNPNLIPETTILPYPSSLSASPYPVPPYRADTPSRPPPNARPTAVEAHATRHFCKVWIASRSPVTYYHGRPWPSIFISSCRRWYRRRRNMA